jgi:hypothetical protein
VTVTGESLIARRTGARSLLLLPPLLALLAAAPAGAQSGPAIRAFGTADQDGCPFCCEFICQGTPTPTPEIDAQGRRVFRRTTGQFMLFVEAGPGPSNRQPGSEGVFSGGALNGVVDPSGKPSLMMLSQRNLGNGSPQVDCRTAPLGGVQGQPGLDFNANVTDALVDMACRFELVTSSAGACTRDRSGNFAFTASGTTRQYCLQVPAVARFPEGDTVLAAELRDLTGNIGERKEIVIRVVADSGQQTATPTATPTPTPLIASIAGKLRYYAGDRPVPSATIKLTGAASLDGSSGGSGSFTFSNMSPGTVTVEPRKIGDFGSPTAITALDAAWVLQGVAGTRGLDARQRLACDVTGNGALSALDATRILQRQVGLLSRFAASELCGSDWVFEPIPGPATNQRLIQPAFVNGACRRGAIALEPLVGGAVQQDFRAMLFGDCTGNWAPPAGAALRALAPAAYTLTLRVPRFARAGAVRAPITVDGPGPYASVDLRLRYDATAVHATAVRPLRAADGAMFIANLTVPGEVRIAVAAAAPIAQHVPLLAVEFDGVPAEGSVSFTHASVDDQPATAIP